MIKDTGIKQTIILIVKKIYKPFNYTILMHEDKCTALCQHKNVVIIVVFNNTDNNCDSTQNQTC